MYSAMQRTLLAITGWSTLFGCATGEFASAERRNHDFSSLASGPEREPTWVASKAQTNTASRSPRRWVPATAPGALI